MNLGDTVSEFMLGGINPPDDTGTSSVPSTSENIANVGPTDPLASMPNTALGSGAVSTPMPSGALAAPVPQKPTIAQGIGAGLSGFASGMNLFKQNQPNTQPVKGSIYDALFAPKINNQPQPPNLNNIPAPTMGSAPGTTNMQQQISQTFPPIPQGSSLPNLPQMQPPNLGAYQAGPPPMPPGVAMSDIKSKFRIYDYEKGRKELDTILNRVYQNVRAKRKS